MDHKNIVGNNDYANLLIHVSNMLNYSYQEIKSKYAEYPHSEINYFEDGENDKSIEIRFDKEGVTITCTFNADEISDFIILFPDKEQTIHEFISYLAKTYDYDFIKTRWITPDYFIKVKELSQAVYDVGFVFISKI